MKICIITHNIRKGDGQGRVNYEVVQELLRRSHSVTIIASFVDVNIRKHPNVKWLDTGAHKIPTAFIRHLVFSVKSAAFLRQHRGEFDIVQTNGAITSGRSDVNAIHFVHSAWINSLAHVSRNRRDIYGLYQWLYTKLHAHWEKQSFKSSSTLVAVSRQVKQELIDAGVPYEKIRVVHNGVDLQEFCPGEADRKELRLPLDVPLAFFAGDIRSSRKNLDTVLKALVTVPEMHLAVAGVTDGSPYLKLAEQLGVGNRVHFLGFRSDISDVMRSVDFFIFPSRYEACTLVLLEAMASGLPVITAITAGGAELVTSDCGFVLSDPNDFQELSSILRMLTQRPDLRIKMGNSARLVAQNYSWKRMASQYIEIFEMSSSTGIEQIKSAQFN
jgi:glycosyltransferase involved in cell wall biosynthesis